METAIRVTRRAAQADEWGLVLASAGIAHRVVPEGAAWALVVPDEDVPRARAALAAYDEEIPRAAARVDAAPPAAELTWMVGATVALFLLAFFATTGSPTAGSLWFARGAASAGDIVAGEWWRVVTALTLHVDAVHVLGNAVATALLVPAVAQRLGAGAGLALMLLAGAVANFLSAMAHDARHVAVGASTATFAAIGILAALRQLPSPAAPRRQKRWVVLAASVVLLVLLGTARGADVLAHALGLGVGAGLGLAAGTVAPRPPTPAVQWSLGGLAALAVAGCWHLALAGAA
jgi:membrane associated rhomboid family serine protease